METILDILIWLTSDWKNWASRRPFVSNFATALIVFLTCLTATLEAPWFVMWPVLAVVIAIVGLLIYIDSKKFTSAILALCLISPSESKAGPQSTIGKFEPLMVEGQVSGELNAGIVAGFVVESLTLI